MVILFSRLTPFTLGSNFHVCLNCFSALSWGKSTRVLMVFVNSRASTVVPLIIFLSLEPRNRKYYELWKECHKIFFNNKRKNSSIFLSLSPKKTHFLPSSVWSLLHSRREFIHFIHRHGFSSRLVARVTQQHRRHDPLTNDKRRSGPWEARKMLQVI